MFKDSPEGETQSDPLEEYIVRTMETLRERGIFNSPKDVEEFFEARLRGLAKLLTRLKNN